MTRYLSAGTHRTLQTLLFILVLLLPAAVGHAQERDDHPVRGTIHVTRGADLEALARITEAQARQAAENAVPGARAREAELDVEDGYLVYEVDVARGGEESEVLVDAGNGSVLAVEREDDEDRDEEDRDNEKQWDEEDENDDADRDAYEEDDEKEGYEKEDAEAESYEAEGDEEASIAVNALPSAVRRAFEAAYPNAEITGAAREEKNGEDYYEIESRDGGTRRDLLYRPDGRVYEVEEAIAASALPAAVTNAVLRQYPGATVEQAEKITRDQVTLYEVQLVQGDRRFGVSVKPDGTVVEAPKH